jgi:hypothetical protein
LSRPLGQVDSERIPYEAGFGHLRPGSDADRGRVIHLPLSYARHYALHLPM